MKFVFFGYDYSFDVLLRLIADGHEVVSVFTFPCDNTFSSNTLLETYARARLIPYTQNKVTAQDLERCAALGTELFLSCGYPYKIPPIPNKIYAVNMHPALLPRVRGIMPTPYVIMHEPQAAGLTLHKLSPRFDAGDILAQHPVKIDEDTDVDDLNARLGLAAPGFVSGVIEGLKDFWKKATPQDESKASHYPPPEEKMRRLEWVDTAQNLNRKARTFGRYGTVATIHNNEGQTQTLAVYNSTAWKEAHSILPGTLLRSSAREIVISIADGYICLKEFQIL